jgi:NitT/TauT family transport system permease protein
VSIKKRIAKLTKADYGGIIVAALVIFLIAFGWESASRLNFFSPIFFPGIPKIFSEFGDLYRSGEIYGHLSISLWRLIIGYSIGVLYAMAVAIAATAWKKTMPSIQIFTALLFALPKVTLLPLLILWLGIDEAPKITVIVLGTYFFTFIPTFEGIRKIDRDLVDAAKLDIRFGAKMVAKIHLPCAIKAITSGLKSGAGAAIAALMATEMLLSNRGLGFLLLQSQQFLAAGQLFAVLLTIAFVSAAFYAVLEIIGRNLFTE